MRFSTASVEPSPQCAGQALLASHCGRSAARHFPDVFFAPYPCRKTGPLRATGQHGVLARCDSPWYHESVSPGPPRPCQATSLRSPQNLVTGLALLSLARSTFDGLAVPS